MAKFHIFLISKKQDFTIAGEDYSAWVVTVAEEDYYFMHPSDPRPDGYKIRNIDGVIASSAGNDMLYYVTTERDIALMAEQANEYAGGGTSVAKAYLMFTVMSYEQRGPSSAWARGTAAKKALLVDWQDSGPQHGTLEEWVTAGYPLDRTVINPSLVRSGDA